MIYHDTRRPLWHARRSGPLFFGTCLLLGAAAACVFEPTPFRCGLVIATALAKLGVEVSVLRHGTRRDVTPLGKTARLITGHFREATMIRLACLMLGGVGGPLLLTMPLIQPAQPLAAAALVLLLAGELIERYLFFTTVAPSKMPGGLPA
jgi:DMSO reductase anchor subunit